jgi:hypothetical protein
MIPISRYSLVIFSLFLSISCNMQKLPSQSPIIYIDQNNNRYIITSEKIEYHPVTVLSSSSGNYSGGEHWKNTVTQQQLASIQIKVRKLGESADLQAAQRLKTTSTLKINSKSFHLLPSDTRIKLEEILLSFKPEDVIK